MIKVRVIWPDPKMVDQVNNKKARIFKLSGMKSDGMKRFLMIQTR